MAHFSTPPPFGFRDDTLESFWDEAVHLQPQEASKMAAAMRWSHEPLQRAHGAVLYAAAAWFHEQSGEARNAAEAYHFAAHAFRTVWMEAKAGTFYHRSFEIGQQQADRTRQEMLFDLRSLGRAIAELGKAGQTWQVDQLSNKMRTAMAEFERVHGTLVST